MSCYLLEHKAPISAGFTSACLQISILIYSLSIQMVRCQESGCTAVLHQPCGHVVCRSHSGCAVRVGDLIVWHPDGCEVCYALFEQFQDKSVSLKLRPLVYLVP